MASDDPRGVDNPAPRLPHLPALDGLRAVAVVAVFLLHAGLHQLPGGHFGVTTFFVLSGFLITALLLCEHEREGRVDLLGFWVRRIRRLAPAALVAVALVAAVVSTGGVVPGGGVLGDGIASLTWVANWRFITDGATYADALGSPSPFQHFWSLAVEEQLYLALPLVAVAALGVRRGGRTLLAVVVAGAVVASTVAAAVLHHPDGAPFRAYYGTDARVAEPLVGVLLALVLVRRDGLRRLSEGWRRVVGGAGLVASAGLAVLVLEVGVRDPRLYRGTFLIAALLAAVVVAAATQPGTAVARALAVGPLPALGRISYGVYLFHWPLLLWLSGERTGLEPLPAASVAAVVTLAVAAASHQLIELPIRQGRLPGPVAPVAWANATVGIAAVLAVAIAVAPAQTPLFLGQEVGAAAPSPPVVAASGGPAGQPAVAASPEEPSPPTEGESRPGTDPPTPTPTPGTPTPSTTPPAPPRSPGAVRIAMLGDSLSGNLGAGMEEWAETRADVVVYNLAVNACPISRGGSRRWPSRPASSIPEECGWWSDTISERTRKLRAFEPDVLVVEDGTNEIPDRYRDEWGRWYRPGDPAFTDWLRAEYRALAAALGPTPVLLLDTPCADWKKYGNGWNDRVDVDGRVLAINSTVYRQDVFGTVVVESLFDELCPNGVYQDEVEGIENGRPDGLHLHPEAARRLAQRWLGPVSIEVARGWRTPETEADDADDGGYEDPVGDGVVP